MLMLAGKTATNSAIVPHPARLRVRCGTTAMPNRIADVDEGERGRECRGYNVNERLRIDEVSRADGHETDGQQDA